MRKHKNLFVLIGFFGSAWMAFEYSSVLMGIAAFMFLMCFE